MTGKAALFGRGDQLDLLLTADMAEVHRPVGGSRQTNADGHALTFGVHGDHLIARPERKACHQRRQIVDAQRAEGVVQIDLERHSVRSEGRQAVDALRAGAGKQADVTSHRALGE